MPNYFKADKKKNVQQTTTPLFDYTALWYTFNSMNEVMRPGEEGIWNLFSSAQRIGWKTGTSFGFRDRWAVGITPKYAVLVWVGNTTDEGRPKLKPLPPLCLIFLDCYQLPTGLLHQHQDLFIYQSVIILVIKQQQIVSK